MGSVTDGWVKPTTGFYLDFGTGTPSGAASGSVTDGPYIMPGTGYAPALPALHGWWDTPVATTPAATTPAATTPAATTPTETTPTPTGPSPASGFDPGTPIAQPTVPGNNTLGNQLANSVLDPDPNFWVGDFQTNKSNKPFNTGAMTTSQT